MSLRELPPDQQFTSTRWRRVRYVPLVVLIVLVIGAIVIGFVARHRIDQAIAAAASAPASPSAPSTSNPFPGDPAAFTSVDGPAATLPEVCRPTAAPPPAEPWLADAAGAEAVWQANSDELANDYVVGKDGWIFWNDVQAMNFSQAVGRRVLSQDEAQRWHDYLAALRDSLASKGIPFFIVVTPAKWAIYPDELPDWAQSIRGSGPLDQLLALGPDLPIVDLRGPLTEAAASNQVFSRVNSHWTDYGAYVGWERLAACIDAVSPQLGPLSAPPSDGVRVIGDFNEYAPYGVTNSAPDWTAPAYTEPLDPVTVILDDGSQSVQPGEMGLDLSLLPARTQTEGAETDSRALVLRDSFGNGLSIFLQQAFSETHQVRHNFDFPDQLPDLDALVSQDQPDIVILQIAQRHLNFPPPAGDQ